MSNMWGNHAATAMGMGRGRCSSRVRLFCPASRWIAQRIVNGATKDLKSKSVQKRVDAIDNLRAWGKRREASRRTCRS